MTRNRPQSGGFTIIEVIVATFGFALIAYGLISLVSNIISGTNIQTGMLSDSDQSRKVASAIMSEIRNAQSSNTGAYAIDTAGDQSLIFYSNADTDSGVEKIRYHVSNGELRKGVTDFNGTTYNPAEEKIYVIQKNLANGATPLFYYYDDTYKGAVGQNPLTQPVNLSNVSFIKLNLQIFNTGGLDKTSYTVTASAAVRNLKTNLGD